MVRLVIIDSENEVVDAEDLSETGLSEMIHDCEQLKEKLEQLHSETRKFICEKHNPLQPDRCITCAIAAKENASKVAVAVVVEYIDPDESKCKECGCSFGVHLIACREFRCRTCGQGGPALDHDGGCPCNPNTAAGKAIGQARA